MPMGEKKRVIKYSCRDNHADSFLFSTLSVDECDSVCFSSDLPSGTNLSNCVLSFRGPTANKWYAITLQVEIRLVGNNSFSMNYL